jgi:hypothetical protein
MNQHFEPQEVDRPFIGRWARATFELILRSPLRFGLVIAALVALDNTVVELSSRYVMREFWIDRAGDLALGALWAFIGALARGADEEQRSTPSLLQFARTRVWVGALGSAAVIVCIDLVFGWATHGSSVLNRFRPVPFLQHPGQLVEAIARDSLLFTVCFGACYFPLLALVPGMRPVQALFLSGQATKINGRFLIPLAAAIIFLGADSLATFAPAYGLTNALFLVFMGVFNYVAYRDIFERRSRNVPQAATGLARTARITR